MRSVQIVAIGALVFFGGCDKPVTRVLVAAPQTTPHHQVIVRHKRQLSSQARDKRLDVVRKQLLEIQSSIDGIRTAIEPEGESAWPSR